MRLTKLTITAFRGMSHPFPLTVGGSNVLVYGENGSSKSSLAHALELLLDPDPSCRLLDYQNVFDATPAVITAEFAAEFAHTRPADGMQFLTRRSLPLTWTVGQPKPLPSWILQSAYRSAFLDHRKLLTLSDRQRDPGRSLFLTAVQHLFGRLPVGASNDTVSMVWRRIQQGMVAFGTARRGRGRRAMTGTASPVAHHTAIETDVNALNNALQYYLLPRGRKPTRLVAEAQRMFERFENLGLDLSLDFELLSFDRQTGSLEGGFIRPHVSFCGKELGAAQNGAWDSTHHLILNEARLTALALALFFAAVRLQDEIEYRRGAGEPVEPLRLLVLDDVLIGLDYEHRYPILDIIQERFLRGKRYQMVLLTHNREWFDLCRLKVGSRGWRHVELFTRREAGPAKSDSPVIKAGASDYVQRAKDFLDQDHDIPAAANYARTAVEWALKELCAKAHVPIPFSLEAHRHDTEEFLVALTHKGRKKLIPAALRSDLEALRKTVLNAYSHWHPTTAVESEVRRAVGIAEKLIQAAKSGSKRAKHGATR